MIQNPQLVLTVCRRLLDCDGHIKLCDFGFTKPNDDGKEVAGYTEIYASPEILQSQPTGPAADWWAVGVVLYECIGGASPFKVSSATSMYDMKRNIVDPNYRIPPFSDSSENAQVAHHLICELLQRNPAERLSSQDAWWNHSFNAGLCKRQLMARQVAVESDVAGPARCSFDHETGRLELGAVAEDEGERTGSNFSVI